MVRVAQNPKPYFSVSSETPPTWRARFRIYTPQEQSGPVVPPGTRLPLRRHLRLAGLWWRYSNPPQSGGRSPHIYIFQEQDRPVKSHSHVTTDFQSVSMSWCRVSLWDLRPDITSCRNVAVSNLRPCTYLLACNFSTRTAEKTPLLLCHSDHAENTVSLFRRGVIS
jgi:hypothetical protein